VTWRLKTEIYEECERLLDSSSLKRILISTDIQQKFPWIRRILWSPGVSVTTGQETKRRTVGCGGFDSVLPRLWRAVHPWFREVHWVVLSSRRLQTTVQSEIEEKYRNTEIGYQEGVHWVVLSSRRLQTRVHSESQEKYSERLVIKKEFSVWTVTISCNCKIDVQWIQSSYLEPTIISHATPHT
jgi:hypothetical protein